MPLLPLPPHEAHLWYTPSDAVTDPGLLSAYEALLSEEEQQRRARYLFARSRHEYLLTRALVRTGLSRYADVPPEGWRFVLNAYGKPEIAPPLGLPPIRFNLANTDGMIVCLVASIQEIGVDVEDIERSGQTVEIADRFFAPAEVTQLRALPAAQQRRRFFEYWTLKEAYLKARGMGLSLPLDQFAFDIAPPASPRIHFAPGFDDTPAGWRFEQFQLSERHLAAAAVRSGPAPLDFVVRRTTPLLD